MKILFLAERDNPLAGWLQEQKEEVLVTCDKIDPEDIRRYSPDLIVSYGYRHILKRDVFEFPRHKTINLHISYLPWNRGADPNPWSHLENTPKGVSIHLIDEGIDTGAVICQREVSFDARATLRSSYECLNKEIQYLFREYWPRFRQGNYSAHAQPGHGTFHNKNDRGKFLHCLGPEGWDVPIAEFKRRYHEIGFNFRQGDLSPEGGQQ